MATHITKQLDEIDFTGDLNSKIESTPADYLVEFFSGIDSPRFYDLCVKSGISKELTIITPSIGVEPFAEYNKRLVHGLSWQSFVKNAENERLVTSFTQKHNEEPSAYVALAYETALWIAEGIKACDGKFNTATYCEAIANASFQSPRGGFTVNSEKNTNQPFPTIIVDGETVTSHSIAVEHEKELVESFSSRVQAGWFNPFPCA